MKEPKFVYHRIRARKGLLEFIEEKVDKDVVKKIGDNPAAWIDELDIISRIATHEPLVAGVGLFPPPIGNPNFVELGNNAFLYRPDGQQNGLWIKKDLGEETERLIGQRDEWTQYRLKLQAVLSLDPRFSAVPFETFLPENFEPKSERVVKVKHGSEEPEKRPIMTFPVDIAGRTIKVYAKGSDICLGFYFDYSKPTYRLTNLSSAQRTTSKVEMDRFLRLASLGVKTPAVVGYYKAPVEEFLFLEEVKGESPDKFFKTHRGEIIRQDARMLASFCLAGLRKAGFEDPDDKIFDGRNLSVIDVDECSDFYIHCEPDYRELLLNPADESGLRKFRKQQQNMFSRILKDTLFRYKETLTPRKEDMVAYARAFYERVGWPKPNQKALGALTCFPRDYQTDESFMAMMCEE